LTVRPHLEAFTLAGCDHNRLESPDRRHPQLFDGGGREVH